MHEKSHAAPASGRASKPSKSVNHRVTFEEWLVRKGYKIKAGGDEMFVLVPSTEMGSKLYPVEVIEVDYTKPADAKDLVYVRYLTTGEVGRSGTPYPAYFTGTEEPPPRHRDCLTSLTQKCKRLCHTAQGRRAKATTHACLFRHLCFVSCLIKC